MADAQRNGKSYKHDGLTVAQRMLQVLADGLPHHRADLMACLHETDAPFTNLQPHLDVLRKQLRPKGEDIVCRAMQNTYFYQHVRLIGSAYK